MSARGRKLRSWRAVRIIAACAGVLFFALSGAAEGITVPIALQGELLLKVASYDRNLGRRAGARVEIVLVAHPNEPSSMAAVLEMQRAVGGLGPVAGLPHDEYVLSFSTTAALLEFSRQKRASIVYLGPGFGHLIESLRAAFDGQDVLTVSAVPDDVAKGIVLGFDLVSSNPKLLVHLAQARRQNVNFRAEILKLMQIYQ